MPVYRETLEKLMSQLTHNEFFTGRFLEDAKKAPKIDGDFIISELDETLFSCSEMKENEEIIRNNPEDAINRIIKFQLGVPYIIGKYYQGKKVPGGIIENLSPETSLILTTGFEDIQKAKLKALGLSSFPIIVMKTNEEKILRVLQYILYELCYIPRKLVIYDKEPELFSEYRKLIEGILETELVVTKVTMERNNMYAKIEEI